MAGGAERGRPGLLTDTLAARPLRLELPLLLAAALAPALPAPWHVLGLGLLGGLWLATRPPRRELLLAGSAWLLAVVLLGWAAVGEHGLSRDAAGWRARAAREYQGLWQRLGALASAARREFPAAPAGSADRLEAFRRLDSLVREGQGDPASVLLVDPDGEAWAWAGRGLLHEPRSVDLPRAGRRVEVGFTALTLLVVEPLGDERRPWRVIVGTSLPTDELPFDPPAGEAREAYRWTVLTTPAPAGDAGLIAVAELPPMLISPPPAAAARARWLAGGTRAAQQLRSLAWGALAFAFLSLAVLRFVSLALLAPRGVRRWAAVAVPSLLGAACAGAGAAVPAPALAWLLLALLAALACLPGLPERWPPFHFLALAVPLPALAFQHLAAAPDLGSELPGSIEAIALRLAGALSTLALLTLAVRRRSRPVTVRGWRWDGLALLVLLAAAMLSEHLWPALLLVVAGAAATQRWLRRGGLAEGVGAWATLLTLAALASAVSWEASQRARLRDELQHEVLPRMAPPSAAAMAAVEAEVRRFLAGSDLAGLTLRDPAGMDRRDLAYALWRRSPLARRNALSALVIEPKAGPSSLFSFGLVLDEQQEVVWEQPARPDLGLPGWDALRLTGRVTLRAGGEDWGVARWWLQPRPGFALGETQEAEQVLVGLLRGAPSDPRAPQGLPAPASYALYPPQGRALVSPWQDLPPVPAELAGREAVAARVRTPSGEAWAFSQRRADGYEVLYLPVLGTGAALERVGTVAASVLLWAAGITLPLLLLALPRPAFRDLLARTVRSYSRRLVLVYTALLLLPLLGLNYVLLRTVESSLARGQRAQGEQALTAAEREVVTTLLSQPQGFAIETAISPSYLESLSRLVDHDVNVYFSSELLSSSTDELFSAGLLPRRIPGEAFARLALLGFGIAARTNQVIDRPFLELYTPVTLPDEPLEPPRIFLSVPLLAQQEEAAGALAAMRRRALVVSTALFALMLVVGSRLARNFTRPLAALVEGTRRIAAGAPSLDLAPSELELAELVRAVDEMAGKIASGREALLREKAVVERMVESITSGVVSLDGAHRVVMHNRVAAELLGSRVGEPLVASLVGRAELAAVGEFVTAASAAPGEPARQTVRIRGSEEAERDWTLVWVPLPGAGEPSALLVVEDVTEVFRSQRLAAWAEMARIIAHEIKNPLTPVRLTAEHMRQVWTTDPEHFAAIFDRCISNILKQVGELQSIASEFSTYSRIPKIEPKRDDLVPMLRELTDAYRTASPQGVTVSFQGGAAAVEASFDARLLSRAVRNLLENAVRASHGGGEVDVSLTAEPGWARIAVDDRGPGVSADLLPRIFDPYFSTHDTGTGLGLPIARRIAEEHGGEIAARNRDGGGLSVEIRIPRP